jgi:lipoic acid synthetase
VPKHWRVLEWWHGDDHAARRYVHAWVQILVRAASSRRPSAPTLHRGPPSQYVALGGSLTRESAAPLGSVCARSAVKTDAAPEPPDEEEPWNTADAVTQWGVDYIVLTSVDRDDLPDGGAAHFAQTVGLLKLRKPSLRVECLVSDFQGDLKSVAMLAQSGLDVYAHNIETVERLQPFVRDKRASYKQSLSVLKEAKRLGELPGAQRVYTKSSIMLGLGETEAEILQTMHDLRQVGVDVLTLGQYLRPTDHHLAVVDYVTPERFEYYRQQGEAMGFRYVASGPMVRSSYKAGELFMAAMMDRDRSEAEIKEPSWNPALAI